MWLRAAFGDAGLRIVQWCVSSFTQTWIFPDRGIVGAGARVSVRVGQSPRRLWLRVAAGVSCAVAPCIALACLRGMGTWYFGRVTPTLRDSPRYPSDTLPDTPRIPLCIVPRVPC